VRAFFLWLSGAPTRIGYADPVAAFFLTHPIAWKGRHSGQHKAQLYRALLAEVGAPTPQRPFPLREPAPGSIILAPGASIALREWPGFVELAQQLRKLYPQSVIRVVGTHAQRAWEARFAALNDPAVESFIGLTTLSELLELCREAQLVVANDSGVAHLAATLAGAPTVVIFGPGDPAYVAPQGPHVRIARAEGVACSPCESARCHARLGYQLCLRQLRVEEVLRQISSLG
jgi:ADP-heptose:LPS heptosyltransferase